MTTKFKIAGSWSGRVLPIFFFVSAALGDVALADETTENFRRDPGWSSVNLPINENDFGYRSSNFAGRSRGEIGGHFSLSDTHAWYGDMDVGLLAGDQEIHASGRLRIRSVEEGYNNNVFIGHFDSDDPQDSGIGIQILELVNDPAAPEFRVFYRVGSVEGGSFTLGPEYFDRRLDWSYEYSPDLGAYGWLQVFVDNWGQGRYLTQEERRTIGSPDTFGVQTGCCFSPNLKRMELYVDDVTYTSSPSRLLWQQRLAESVPAEAGAHVVAVSSRNQRNKRVYVAGRIDERFAVNAYVAETGALLWSDRAEGNDPISCEGRARHIATSDNGRVFAVGQVDCQFAVRAFDGKTGRLLWSDQTSGFGDAVAVIAGLERVWVAGRLPPGPLVVRAYDAASGRLLWENRSTDRADIGGRGAMVRHNDMLFVGGWVRNAPGERENDMYLAAYNSYTGQLRWTQTFGGAIPGQDAFTALAYDRGRVFASGRVRNDLSDPGNSDFAVHAYDAYDGSLLWLDHASGSASGRRLDSADAIVADHGRVFAGGQLWEDGKAQYTVRAYNGCCGELLWEDRFPAGAGPTIARSLDVHGKQLFSDAIRVGRPNSALVRAYRPSGKLRWADEFGLDLSGASDIVAWGKRVAYVGVFRTQFGNDGYIRVYCDRKCRDTVAGLHTIRLNAHIDGRSQLIIQGNTVQWHHLDFAAPGRHEFRNEPTIINDYSWLPAWPDNPDEENRDCDCYSDLLELADPALPQKRVLVGVNLIQAREQVKVIEQPTAENNYTLVLEFNDNWSGGSDDYEIELRYLQ